VRLRTARLRTARLRTARLRTALGRAPARRRPGRRFTPVEQVLHAPVRPLSQHVHHHQHLSSTTLQLRLAVGVQIAPASHPIRLQAVPRPPARGPVAAPATYPGVVFRDQAQPPAEAAGTVAGPPAWPAVPLVHSVRPPAVQALRAARGGRGALPPVDLVHRLPAPSASGAAMHRPADARTDGTAERAGTRWAGPGAPAAPGATPLTAADVPGVVDQVVREIDRRVTAARERRGWTA
jgi:hypothetical protein